MDDVVLAQRQAQARRRRAARTFAPKAKRVIYLFMAGAPSQLDLFDPKPELTKHDGQDIPEEFVKGERFAFIKGTPKLLGSPFKFKQHGQSGAEISELLPHLAKVADDIAIVRSMQTTQFNHAPAQIFMNTGHQVIGRPSLGSWLSYGLGSENSDLPGFVVLLSGENNPDGGKSCWGSGFLPTVAPGRRVPLERRPGAVRLESRRRRRRTTRGRSIAAINDLNRLHAVDVRRPRDPDAHRRLRAGLPDADQRAGADRHLERAGVDPRAVRHRARARRRSPTTACSRAAWSSAASASSSSITAAGTPTAPPSARTSSKSCRTCAGRPIGRSTACSPT